uniref:Guanylate kinase-like domain-containing protein n=1 Tax=Hippocampus comes TaxID=109280 RepID=A0A3Q2XLX9_HIPCM
IHHILQFLKKSSGRVRLVSTFSLAGGPKLQNQLFLLSYTRHVFCAFSFASKCVCACIDLGQEEHLIPYSLVQPVKVGSKRPVIFSPSLLSRGLIERMMQPVDSGLQYNTCAPGRSQIMRIIPTTNAKTDKHCLLELGLPCVEGLLRQGIYPIVIHILQSNHFFLTLANRKFFPRCEDESVMEEMCQAEQLQLETLPLLYCTLEPGTWSCTEDLLAAIRNAISSQQMSVTWVELDRLQ